MAKLNVGFSERPQLTETNQDFIVRRTQEIEDSLKSRINNLGESAAEAFGKVLKKQDVFEQVLNRHGEVLVSFRDKLNQQDEANKLVSLDQEQKNEELKKINEKLQKHIKYCYYGAGLLLLLNLITIIGGL